MIFPIVRSKRPPIVNAQDLIRAREARGLMWSLAARLVFVTIIVIFVVLHLLHLISPGIAAQTDRDAAGMLAIQLGAALFILYFMHLARRQTKLTVAGLGAVILDVSLVSLMAVIWYNSLSLPGGSPAFLMKDEFAVIGVVFVAVNALALRPVYPALAAGGFISGPSAADSTPRRKRLADWPSWQGRRARMPEARRDFSTSAVRPTRLRGRASGASRAS